jgi:hypothetical protein
MKKKLNPILHKGDSTKSRIEFYKIMQDYLQNLQPCLQTVNGKLVLVKDKNEPVVKFNKQIGSKSRYGMAYMNLGKGFGKLLKFSCKLMSDKVPGHAQEVKILKHMSDAVIQGKTPNMPITYLSMHCNKPCKTTTVHCPDVTRESGYFVVINELASMDLETFLKKSHTSKTYESILFQVILSLYSFHRQIGYSHNDAHLGNYLIHEITPGGFWRYKINGKEVYVPNVGYLVVLWDPGMATPVIPRNLIEDYHRTLGLVKVLGELDYYRKLKLVPLPFNLEIVIDNILQYLYNITFENENEAMTYFLEDVAHEFKTIQMGGSPPGYLLNIKPYKID